MADVLMWSSVAVAALNMALALALVVVYARIYQRTKAPFTGGLILFSTAFLIQNALVAYAYLTMMPVIAADLTPYLLGIGILEAAGLAAVVWTALK